VPEYDRLYLIKAGTIIETTDGQEQIPFDAVVISKLKYFELLRQQ
jgi:hypothetical protein